MDKKIIENALASAKYLIEEELESVCDDDLRSDYMNCLTEIDLALKEINSEE